MPLNELRPPRFGLVLQRLSSSPDRHMDCYVICCSVPFLLQIRRWSCLGEFAMRVKGHINWPLLLAVVAVLLTGMAAFRCHDWGGRTALRLFIWPVEDVLRRAR